MTCAMPIPSLPFLDHSLFTIRTSPPVLFPRTASYSIRVTSTPCPLSSKQSQFQVAGIGYRRVRDGSGLTYSAIDRENDTHTMFYPPNTPNNAVDPHTLPTFILGKVIRELSPGGRPNRFLQFRKLPLGCFQIPQASGGYCRRRPLLIPFCRRHRVRHG